ncbi:probable glycerol-3-phosphate acyltransferase 2 [Carya illinoinensis]|uniref:Phospholipid/glycerol acyltransferase domain-containing protein n=1 Tax=Carya illinoinensis TaxID=32201 RepID=A0A8T1Q6Y7_CARIL|nr:probable glycerol-3-phosphate acyltransferase 2 [Carya illinoinensis]KAG6650164.1 hypothetical protein CIPAW_06G023300 [Carya illinoinensis]
MAGKPLQQKAQLLFGLLRGPQNRVSSVNRAEDLSNKTLVFDSEGTLLRSSSFFPYFMLVAFEAGGLLRAIVFFLLYPLVCLFGEELGLKIKVFLCFFGIKKESFRIGTSVLPKFFLEDVGCEGFEMVMSFGRKVAVSNLPTVMVEGFLKDYLGVDAVVGRELKVVCGYFVGLMEDKRADGTLLDDILGEEKTCSGIIASVYHRKVLDQHPFTHCEEFYLVSRAEKRNWHILPRVKYPKPLIFHDGRLAFRPTQLDTLAMLMWIPFGIFIFLIRFNSGRSLPNCMLNPILAFTGIRTTVSRPNSPTPPTNINKKTPNGVLYACNHRTLLDPLFLDLVLNNSPSAVTYGISKFYAAVSPIKNVNLTRDREKDRAGMQKLLSQGDLVVCPEGTTCREPYLLRFSPLFAELTDDIVPVAIDSQVSMFYGTTASGYKFLDPVFYLMNPFSSYTLRILEKLPGSHTCKVGGISKFDVANHVQKEIARASGFECTSLTRKDKYMILAGNEGIVQGRKRL